MWTDMRVHLALFTASVGYSYRALSSVSHLIPAPSREFGSRGTLGPCCVPAACRGQRQGRGVQPARALVTEGGWVSATYQPLEPAPRPLSAGAAPGVAVAAWGAAAVTPVPLSPRAPAPDRGGRSAARRWPPLCPGLLRKQEFSRW